jgi:integrase
LASLQQYNASADPRHVRRELSADELIYTLRFVETYTKPGHALPGPDRAMLYHIAVGTGFRAKELRSLTPASFQLASDPPTVTVGAAYSKRGRADTQPIRKDLAYLLRPWLKSCSDSVFARLPKHTARMIRADLNAARKAWIDESHTAGERE